MASSPPAPNNLPPQRHRLIAREQEVAAIFPEDEIEQAFALRIQEAGPDRQRSRHILCNEALQEAAHVFAGHADNCSIGKGRGRWAVLGHAA